MATPKVNSFLSEHLVNLKAKDQEFVNRTATLEAELERHKGEHADLKAAIKHLETSPNAQVPPTA